MKETCRQCGGDGYYVSTTSGHGCNGTQEDCNRSCPVPVPVQEPCEMCEGTGQVEEGQNPPEISSIKEVREDDLPF